jgi:hypothetical protein
MSVYSTRDMKSGLVRKLGTLPIWSSGHRQNYVAVGCPLVSAMYNLYLVCIETATFGEPYAQLLVSSRVHVKPDELTSLDFR